jgi:drug/metabolite transporter (DMT)-like permease
MLHFAIISALSGCLASVAGKYAFDAEKGLFLSQLLCKSIQAINISVINDSNYTCSDISIWIIRLLWLLLLLFFNSLMLNYLLISMHHYGTVYANTIINSISFICSGILGYSLFNENINLQWIIGILLICAGVAILNLNTKKNENQQTKATKAE